MEKKNSLSLIDTVQDNFKEVFEKYHTNVLSWIDSKGIKSQIEKDEITQIVFLAYKDKAKKEFIDNPRAMLYSITKNQVKVFWASTRRNREKYKEYESSCCYEKVSENKYLTDIIHKRNEEQKDIMLSLLNEIAPFDKQLLELKYKKGLKYSELESLFGLSEDCLKQKVSRAKKQLREEYKFLNNQKNE